MRVTNSTDNLEKAQNNQKRIGAAESDPETFYLTKRLVDRFDGLYLWFNITEVEAQEFRVD